MISRLVSLAAATGVAVAVALAAPAVAATTPTLTGPAQRTGFGTVTLTGTAAPGAIVHLYESAIGWNDLQPAEDWAGGSGTVTATADGSGRYSIVRQLDSGFYFQTEADGLRSARITVRMQVLPTFWVRSTSAGVLDAKVSVSPNADGLTVQFQRRSGTGWTTAATAVTDAVGAATHRFTGLPRGEYTYRASVLADPQNGVLANVSTAHSTYVAGAPGSTPAPAAGDVQFTEIRYNSAGADSGTNTSLNGEWARLTNRTRAAVDLNGWTVRDAGNHTYKFSGTLMVPAGASIVVFTGRGTNTGTRRYWGRAGTGGYIWNNGGDTALLRTPSNKTIDTCKWTGGSGTTRC